MESSKTIDAEEVHIVGSRYRISGRIIDGKVDRIKLEARKSDSPFFIEKDIFLEDEEGILDLQGILFGFVRHLKCAS